ncbi:P-loop containing nucleoside triphosphate hydrolase protein [Haematococcus lacustris]
MFIVIAVPRLEKRVQQPFCHLGGPASLHVPRGETAGAAMVIDKVSIQAGDRDLLEEVSLRVMPGQRWGLVGSNGCGKSTLLKALCGFRPIDAGRLIVAPKVEVGYLAQTAVSGSQRTVYQEARSQMTSLLKAEEDMRLAERDLAAGDPTAAERLARAQDAVALAGGADVDRRIANVLTGLGFRHDQFHVSASQFSGGWQMRIALARLLLGEAGQAAAAGKVACLPAYLPACRDEPTNHLDSSAIRWLGNFLRTSGGTLVVVSHDEALLEDVCDHIVEQLGRAQQEAAAGQGRAGQVRGKKLHAYTGTYSHFMEQRALRDAQALATAAAQQAEIDKLETFINKFGAKASKAKSAQSKAKLADKLRAEKVEAPAAASAAGGGDRAKVHLRLPRAPPCFTDVLLLNNATIGWGTPDNGTQPLLQGVDLVIKKGQRVLVLGPNGAGKSTLLKALSGQLPLWSGTRKEGDGVKLGVFSQDLAQDLPLDKAALSYVEDVARQHNRATTQEQCRSALGALGLTGSMALQQIGVLSGGEKARVALAGFALVPSNVLLLDEASNHLDAATIAVLTGALQDFAGAIVAITHNPAFAASLNATHILRVADGRAVLSTNMGLTDADFEHEGSGSSSSSGSGVKKAGSRGSTPGRQASAAKSPAPSKQGATPSPSHKAAQPPPAAAAAAAVQGGNGNGVGSGAGKAAGRKRVTLSWGEQQEYQKLSKEVVALQTKRDSLQQLVAKLASTGGKFKELEAASMELSLVSEAVDTKEMRWLELAEIAGDI